MQKLNVAVIGLGFIGKQHVEALRRIPSVVVVAVSDMDLSAGEWCARNDIPRFYTNFEEMLEKESLDVVHNCTPNFMHYAVNRKVLEAGICVYSEKPLTTNAEEGKQLVKLAEEKSLTTGVNFNYRNNLMVQEMHYRVACGQMGEITHLQVEYLQDWLLYRTDFDWRVQTEKGGVSRAVADIGSHCFDTLQYILNEKIVSVYAIFRRQYKERWYSGQKDTFSIENVHENAAKLIPVENEDAAIIMVRMQSGIIGSVIVTQICAGKKNGLKLLLSGNQEAYEWNQEIPDKLWIGHRNKGNEIIYVGKTNLHEEIRHVAELPDGHPVGWKDALTTGFEQFYESILNKDNISMYPDFKDGYYISKVVDACVESARLGYWVNVE